MSSSPLPINQEANLVFFLRDRLEPALQRSIDVKHSEELSAIYSSLDLLESFFWLHLGVRVGYFPQPLSRRVVYEHSIPMFRAYDRLEASRRIETLIAQPMRTILSTEFSGALPLLNVPERVRVPQLVELASVFQNPFLMANRFALNGQVAGLVAAISLASDSVWQKAISKAPTMSREIQMSEDDLTWSYEGFFEVIDYLSAVRELHRNAIAELENRAKHARNIPPDLEGRDRDALDRFFEQLKQIQQWRFNFGYLASRERILQAALNVTEAMLNAMKTTEGPEEIASGVQVELYDLLQYWGAPSKSFTAGA